MLLESGGNGFEAVSAGVYCESPEADRVPLGRLTSNTQLTSPGAKPEGEGRILTYIAYFLLEGTRVARSGP